MQKIAELDPNKATTSVDHQKETAKACIHEASIVDLAANHQPTPQTIEAAVLRQSDAKRAASRSEN